VDEDGGVGEESRLESEIVIAWFELYCPAKLEAPVGVTFGNPSFSFRTVRSGCVGSVVLVYMESTIWLPCTSIRVM